MSPTDAGKSRTRAEKATSQELNNPCVKEQKLSLKCLDDNGYDKEKCTSFFVNYNMCQKFWRERKKTVGHIWYIFVKLAFDMMPGVRL